MDDQTFNPLNEGNDTFNPFMGGMNFNDHNFGYNNDPRFDNMNDDCNNCKDKR